MVEIYIDNRLVELDKTDISLQKEFENAVENIPTEIEYSYTISIPATLNNKEIFGFADVFDVSEKFKRLYNADLYVDEQLILSGKFKVTSIEGGYYKGNIYNPKKKTISDILGERNLNNIIPHYKPMNGLEDFDKINNYVCGLANGDNERLPLEWNDETHPETADKNADVFDNHVVFPYVLYGLPLNNSEAVPLDFDKFTQDLEYGKHNIGENNIYPAFNVISILKDIFKTEGYNLTGNIIDGNMKDFFKDMYQTFQYSNVDYIKEKEIPFYCKISGNYWNYAEDTTATGTTKKYVSSPSLELMSLWSTNGWRCEQGDDIDHDGNFWYGVDNPWSCGGKFASIRVTDEKHMFTYGTSDKDTGILTIPQSGWYKINFVGSMDYPDQGNKMLEGTDKSSVPVGGTKDEADCTDLSEQPFEFQLKKGFPKEHSTLYSFNSFIPMAPNQYFEDNSVAMEEHIGETFIKVPNLPEQRRYAKNGKTALIKDYSNFQTNDFICGVRLGGAWFSSQWTPAGHGGFQRKNRFMAMGAGLALPDVTKTIVTYPYEDDHLFGSYKRNQGTFDGMYFKIADKNSNATHEYAEKTAQCLVRNDSYSNFEGYNEMVGSGRNYTWDTTSNYGRREYEGAEPSSARTGNGYDTSGDKYNGWWEVNTCVWLEEGDMLYLEVLMPLHTAGSYRHSTALRASKWENRKEWVNATRANYNLTVGFVTSDADWKPKSGNGIPSFDDIKTRKLTNVNQFLPQTKCNDYIEKFLKTFNLKITQVNSDTFSIDTIGKTSMNGNVIDIDGICNIEDAEFKPLSSESTKEFKWKIDTSETGYVQGNKSPHMSGHSEQSSASTWFDSGYTGSETITNEANSSGSSKKTEAPWSYNWYKTIKFDNNYYPIENQQYADISVIADSDLWKEGVTYSIASGEAPQTSKTTRLFMLKKNQAYRNEKYSYISFKYDNTQLESTRGNYINKDKICNLVLPSNYVETIDLNGLNHRVYLDYKKMNNTYDGKSYNNGLLDIFFNENVSGGYDIEVPIKLSNADYAAIKQGTLFKLNDGLYKVKSIQGHDVNTQNDATLTLTTLK